MIVGGTSVCPICSGDLKYYDTVKRTIMIEYGIKSMTDIRRLKCVSCYSYHREIVDTVYPYKRYTKYIIDGFISGDLSVDDIVFEDFPSEHTVKRWISQKTHILLWNKKHI